MSDVLDTPEQITTFRLATLVAGLRLECVGLRKHAPSCLSVLKREYGLKGSKAAVLKAAESILKQRKAELQSGK